MFSFFWLVVSVFFLQVDVLPWKEYRMSNGTTYWRWVDAEGNIHNRYPITLFPGKEIPNQWTPVRNQRKEWCWSIKTDGDCIQTWQPPFSIGRPYMTEDEFVTYYSMPKMVENYGVVHQKLSVEAKEAQEHRPGHTAEGNGPKTVKEYEEMMEAEDASHHQKKLHVYRKNAVSLFLIAVFLVIFPFSVWKSRKGQRNDNR